MERARAKAFGAFYTGEAVAEFLLRWAVRKPDDTVLDPSFGGGVFLAAAAARLGGLGGEGSKQIYGVELDEEVYARVSQELPGVSQENLIRSDFFALETTALPPLDAVVGNPPFIRYQRFDGEQAAVRARAQGVTLSKLVSSWAPFLVYSAAFLKPGGRLGMVVPTGLGHAAYARPVLAHLTQTFGRVTLLTFRARLFPEISQDTLLVLAENKHGPLEGIFWRDLSEGKALTHPVGAVLKNATKLPHKALTDGREKLVAHLLLPEARALYTDLAAHPGVVRLGTFADVGIGHVTGANSFFHLSSERVAALGLPRHALKRAVFRGAALSGLAFTETDWHAAAATNAGYLFHPVDDGATPALTEYLQRGEAEGVPQAYKCRARTPWYRVPHVYAPDALLTYMSGLRPQFVANDAQVVAPNTLHLVRLRPDLNVAARTLAAFWQTSLTSLSVELEGHALGGGLLKLEPSEARQVLLAAPAGAFEGLETELGALLRRGEAAEAQALADRVLLQDQLGLSAGECAVLQEAARTLRDRRYYQGKARAATGKTPASFPRPPAS